MQPNPKQYRFLTAYRGRIAKIRYYLAQLSGGGGSPQDVLKYCALITYELNRLPYAQPQPKRGLLSRILGTFKP